MNFAIRGLPAPPGPYNPFQADVIFLGKILQRWVRVSTISHAGKLINLTFKIQPIADIVPEIGPFFDSMIDDDGKKRLTARQALEAFQKIHSALSPSQLSHPVAFIKGVFSVSTIPCNIATTELASRSYATDPLT
jgi:hypothetical protein